MDGNTVLGWVRSSFWKPKQNRISRSSFRLNNPTIAIAGEWFTAHGKGINLGYWGKEENHLIAEKLKNAFAEWIDKISITENQKRKEAIIQ